MRRTKEFWSRLNKQERSYLVYLDKASNQYGYRGGYLPDDCSECAACWEPMLGSGICQRCSNDHQYLIRKGNNEEHAPLFQR